MQTETIHQVLASFIFYLQTKLYWRIMSRFILRYKIDPCILRVRPSKKIRMNTKIVNRLESIQHKNLLHDYLRILNNPNKLFKLRLLHPIKQRICRYDR